MDATIYRWGHDGSEASEEEVGPCGCGPACDHPEAVAIPVDVEVDVDGGEVCDVWATSVLTGQSVALTSSERERLMEQAERELESARDDAAMERHEARAERW